MMKRFENLPEETQDDIVRYGFYTCFAIWYFWEIFKDLL